MARSRWGSACAIALAGVASSCGSMPEHVVAAPLPPLETVGEYVNGVEGPVLGVPSSLHLYMRAGHSVVSVDLATGLIARTELDLTTPVELLAGADGMFVSDHKGFVATDPQLGVRVRGAARSLDFLADASLWSVTAAPGGIGLEELDSAGATRRSVTLAIDNDRLSAWEDFDVAGTVGNEVVLAAHGRIILVDLATRVGRTFGLGSLVAVGGGRIVWTECLSANACQTYAGSTTNARLVTLARVGEVRADCGPTYEGGTWVLCPIAISANGRWMLGRDLGASYHDLLLWDLETGAHRLVEWPTSKLEPQLNTDQRYGVDGVAMSPDGAWLFAMQESGRMTAVHVATRRVVEFDVFKPLAKAEGLIDTFAVG